ncbi:MAG: carboxypeptidase regulatory-like domain-containing protein, partial [Candidatus Kapaibacterium sp.]
MRSRFPLRFLCTVLFSVACTLSVLAQDPTGSISGKVTDGETGDPLVRATVMITVNGKTKGTFADSKGAYALRNVPVGEYDVRFRFLGFQEKVMKRVVVQAGKTVNADVVLKHERKTTADVVVEAKAARETEAAILTQRKNAAQVSDGVSEQEIKRQTDNDAGQVLKRVSGVTLVGDKFVYVRGINERYNNTTLNGASLASTENDKKAFAFDMFPAEFLQNASVVKSFTPDLPGNFAGGLVQLQTVDFPDGYAVRMSGGAGGTDNLTGRSNAFTTYSGGS